jgi:hypothetical protein
MKGIFKKLFLLGILAGTQFSVAAATPEEHVVYGVRVYDTAHESQQALVSFPLNDISKITIVQDFSDLDILSAACDGDNYYFITTQDGMVPYSFYSFNLTTKSLSKVTDYEVFVDAEASLLPLDMTYDSATGNLYLMAYDLSGWTEESDDEPFGLYRIDRSTGKATLVGYEETALVVALAADPDGMLYGVSDQGELYEISKRNGRLGEIYCESGYTPSSKQSATFDSETGKLYWAGFNTDSFFGTFTFGEEMVTYDLLGALPNKLELIGLYIDTDPVNTGAPAAVEELEFYPAANGYSENAIFWMNPTTNVGGSALEGTFSVEISRDDVVVANVTDLQPGKDGYYVDREVPSGLHTYKFRSYNDYGFGGVIVGDPVYVGVDVPAAVGNLTAVKSATDNSISISWDAPLAGANNGYCDLSALTYSVTRLPDNKVLTSDLAATSFTDSDVTEAKGYRYVVAAYSNGNKGIESTSNKVISGEPLSVPYSCDFSNEEANDLWTAIDADNDGYTWYTAKYNNGTHYMRYYPVETLNPDGTANDWAISAPIHLEKGKNYLLSFEIWGMGDLFPVNYTVAYGNEATQEAMTNVLDSKEYEYLPQALGNVVKYTVTPEESGTYYFGLNVQNRTFLNFTNVNVVELYDHDGVVTSFTGPSSANVNSPATFTVGVLNNGSEDIMEFDICLIDIDINEPLATEHYEIPLASLDTAEVELQWTPTTVRSYNLYAMMVVTDEQHEDDNISDTLALNVMPAGNWHDITDGTSYGMLAPFGTARTNSASQTIYLKNEINAAEGDISCLKYYYYITPGATYNPINMDVKLYMANTDLTMNGSAPVAVEDMELVYEGNATIDGNLSDISFILDKKFHYTGNGLIVHAEHASSTTSYLLNWIVKYDDSAPDRAFIYYGNTPYAGGDMTSWVDVANVSFLFENESGVNAAHDIIAGDIKSATLVSVAGQVIARYSNAADIDLSSLQPGIYILNVIDSNNNSTATKFAVK